jgi:Na+-translocating ferredoxin:NAD+ oxidoreductase RnfD subunit
VGRKKAVRHKINMSALLALCGLALLAQHVGELGTNFTGDHLIAGALMLMAVLIVLFLPSQPEEE